MLLKLTCSVLQKNNPYYSSPLIPHKMTKRTTFITSTHIYFVLFSYNIYLVIIYIKIYSSIYRSTSFPTPRYSLLMSNRLNVNLLNNKTIFLYFMYKLIYTNVLQTKIPRGTNTFIPLILYYTKRFTHSY